MVGLRQGVAGIEPALAVQGVQPEHPRQLPKLAQSNNEEPGGNPVTMASGRFALLPRGAVTVRRTRLLSLPNAVAATSERAGMCGIAGYTSLPGDRPIDARYLGPMLKTIYHRGPDDHGTFFTDRVALANARLAIVDLKGGRQPIVNEDDSVVVVYNGEIYNHRELRAKLQALGHRFRTATDTEVIVHLYEEEGEAFIGQLDGMFAFALFDKARELLLVARDRFGVKPLFYSRAGDELRFASEIKALRVFPDFDSALSPEGVATALGLMFVADPWTAYRDVRRLRAGHFLRISRDGVEELPFADWHLGDKLSVTRGEAAEETAVLLRDAVRRQMIADVPIGVLLSGGLDSRTMALLASRERDDVQAFTISFDEADFDEGDAAADWAAAIGVTHHRMRFSEDDFCDHYVARQAHLDEPYSLWCNVASAQMAEQIHARGFKVVIGGDGGDELFLGYPTVNAAVIARWYRLLPALVRQQLIRPLARALPAGNDRLPVTFMAKSFVEADDPDLLRNFFGFKEVIRFKDWPGLLTPEALDLVGGIDPFIAHRQYLANVEGLEVVDALSYLDFRVFLPGVSLYGADNAYMASSVELRVPFLDNALADFAGRLPVDVRFDLLKVKPVLREALLRHILARSDLGAKIALKNYRKAGFEVPGSVWLRKQRFAALISEILGPKRIARGGFFRPDAVTGLLEEQLTGRQNNERVLQAICAMSLFLENAA